MPPFFKHGLLARIVLFWIGLESFLLFPREENSGNIVLQPNATFTSANRLWLVIRVVLVISYFLTHSRYGEAKGKGIDNYDRELEDVIDKLIGECDRKIGRALKRLEDEDAKAAVAISVSDVTQVPFQSILIAPVVLACEF